MSFAKGELDGAGYGTNGHLMTIVGFTRDGDVVVNDPASHLVRSDDAGPHDLRPRQQFSNAWIGHTGGHRLRGPPRVGAAAPADAGCSAASRTGDGWDSM